MNYIKHLTGFFDKVAKDKHLNPTHVSLYIALFQFWNYNRFKNPISITRDEVMRISKISSKATYHKCLKALHEQGYIKYEPSYNPFKGSHVFLFNFSDDLKPLPKTERSASPNFEPVGEQVVNQSGTASGTGSEQVDEQVLVPSINNTNITNNQNIENALNLGEPEKKIEEFNSGLKSEESQKEKSSGQKEKGIPTIEEILAYFLEQDFPKLEANKFFNYFQSIGWLVGGKTPMADWQSSARNWMLNAPKYAAHDRTDRNTSLDNSGEKDFAEPL
ncbi:transcriptional regulator [Flavobacterium sp.]|uniref:transcriptional regulator n=1 Tax=Flavobacterium sp. TaxID=239 RepID=UPI002621150D|nr:transcriptional regulator [Flavobacterium sp.]